MPAHPATPARSQTDWNSSRTVIKAPKRMQPTVSQIHRLPRFGDVLFVIKSPTGLPDPRRLVGPPIPIDERECLWHSRLCPAPFGSRFRGQDWPGESGAAPDSLEGRSGRFAGVPSGAIPVPPEAAARSAAWRVPPRGAAGHTTMMLVGAVQAPRPFVPSAHSRR